MNHLVRCVLVVTLVAVTLAVAAPQAWAQARGERGRGGGFGPGLIAIANQKSVQEELKVTEEQAKTITALAEKQREAMRGFGRDASPEDRQKMREQATANEKALEEALQPEQFKRLKQITLQQQGLMAAERPDIAESLQLTSEQKTKIREIGKETADKMRELRDSGNREEAMSKMTELRKANQEKLMALLTDEQKSKWKELTGEPFAGEIQLFGGGRRRPEGAPRATTP